MDYKPQKLEVPAGTAKLARKVFKKGNPLLKLRDELGIIYENSKFADLFSHRGRQAEAPGNLALVLILQYIEGLSDQQAAECVRARIDWKYLLGLELEDEGFHYDVLQRFRKRLLEGGREQILLEHLLEQCKEKGWLNKKQQRTDSTQIVGAVRRLNRLELVGETMRIVLEELAVVAPHWLASVIPSEWVLKYRLRFEARQLPTKREEQTKWAEEIGQDGYFLWQSIEEAEGINVGQLEGVESLRQIWLQQYYIEENQVRWRRGQELPPAAKQICSPHDPQMRYSVKRDETWVGYKLHLTETFNDKRHPQLITDVLTTAATVPDVEVTATIQNALREKGVEPETHLVDQGYVDADNLATSQESKIDLVGPAPKDTSWQNKQPDGIALDQFIIDWEQRVVTCPEGMQSTTWSEGKDTTGNAVIHVRFPRQTCLACPQRMNCTHATKNGRSLKFKPEREHIALQLARQRQQEEKFKILYKKRAGVEGTICQTVYHHDARRSRYIGFAKTHLHNLLTAVAVNFIRIGRWLLGEPRTRTRISPLDSLVFI